MPRISSPILRKLASGHTKVHLLDLVSPEYEAKRLTLPVQPSGYYDQAPADDSPEVTEGAHYAWVSTPRWTGDENRVLRETHGNIRVIDLGSAFPIYASLLRSLSFERAHRRAVELTLLQNALPTLTQPTIRQVGGKTNANALMSRVFSRSTPHDINIRMRLEAGIQRLIYSMAEGDTADLSKSDFPDFLANHLMYEFVEGTQLFLPRQQATYEGRRQIDIETVNLETPLPDVLANMDIRTPEALALARTLKAEDGKHRPAPEQLLELRRTKKLGSLAAYYILDDLSTSLGRAMASRGLTRSYHVLSVDNAARDTIRKDALSSFDATTQQTGIFQRALEDVENTEAHAQESILDFLKSQPDESITYMITVECFPYFFGSDVDSTLDETYQKMEVVRDIVLEAVRALQPGGRLVAIPMNIKGNQQTDDAIFKRIRQELLDTGKVKVLIREYSAAQVRAFADQADAGGAMTLSPMMEDALGGDSIFRVLEIEKLPIHRSSMPATPQKKVQVEQDPTQ